MDKFLRLGQKLSKIYIGNRNIEEFNIVVHTNGDLRGPGVMPATIEKAAKIFQKYVAMITDITLPIIFDNYESFATFMETPTNYYEIDGDVIIEYATVFDYNSSASEVIPDDKFIDDGYTYIDKIEIKDEKGNVLCSFRQKNRSVARYTLSDTPNRLPIKVYTYEACNNANDTCEIICSIFALFIGADAICFFYGYFSNTKKSLRKS